MPEKLITYTQKFTVYRTDGDHLGHVKLGALLRYAQQVATAHAEAVGLDDALYRKTHTAYVLAKLALHVTRLPRVDEELTLVTQPERCKRAVNKRITHFYDADGAEVATMDSRWVLIDTEKRMILRKHPEQFADLWAEDVPLELPMRLPRVAPEDCETLGTQTASTTPAMPTLSATPYRGRSGTVRRFRISSSATTARYPAARASPCAVPPLLTTSSTLTASARANPPLNRC